MQISLFGPRPRKPSKLALFADELEGELEGDPDGLRWYQREASDAAFRVWGEGSRSGLIVAATGTGKTQIFSAVTRQWLATEGSPVLVLAHRDELVGQAVERLEQITGEQVEIEQADLKASKHARIVVASVQTIYRERRLEKFGPEHFGLIIADEAHHYVAKTYRKPLDYFTQAKVLGVTATPDRGDAKAMGRIFDDVAYVFDIGQGIENGYLVPLEGRRVTLDAIRLDGVTKTAGDLSDAQLDEAMIGAVEGIVQKTLDLEPDRQGVCFFPGRKTAELAMARFNALRPNSACYIDGNTPKDVRKSIVRAFKEGRYQYLCNCQVATEGFDAPAASLIVIGRPTLSRSLYAQMVGRGTRVLPGVVDWYVAKEDMSARRRAIAASEKPNCMVLDFVGNSTKHDLMTPEDLLGGSFTDEEVERAKAERKAKGEDGQDPREALMRARRELQELANQLQSQVAARVSRFDPFRVMDIDYSPEDRAALEYGQKPATRAQREFLLRKGVPREDLEGLSGRAAKRLIDNLNERHKQGLCTYKQLRQIKRFGITETNVTFERAKEAVDYIAATGWGKPAQGFDPQRLHEIVYRGREAGED
jgi:superfamily II DNA or RNA helicase